MAQPYTDAALLAYLQAHPVIFPATRSPASVAAIMNSLTLTPALTGAVPNDPMSVDAFMTLFKGTEAAIFTALHLAHIGAITRGSVVRIGHVEVQSWLTTVFTSVLFPSTNAAIVAAATRTGTPAEVQFGTGFVITNDMVQDARGN